MCQLCRLGQRLPSAKYSPVNLLDTGQFSSLVVTDHRWEIEPSPSLDSQSPLANLDYDHLLKQDDSHS